jgi:bifunctional non-homologous end joining protein LigD
VTVVEVDGRDVTLTNVDKVLWPATGLTKGRMIEYYVRVSGTLLPHLAGRPLTLRRFPDGVEGISWHQNECRGEPDWFRVFVTPGKAGRLLRFCVVEDTASLVWVANQAAVELHPFLWRIAAPREPTQLVLDLDPGPPAGLLEAARVALAVRPILEGVGLPAYVKTSGSLGLHVHAPLEDSLDTKSVAREIARIAAAQHPDLVVGRVDRAARAGKVYVDWLQNDPTRQTVAPYSLRATPTPLVAAPLHWEEVERALSRGRDDLLRFGPEDVLARIEREGDLFDALR